MANQIVCELADTYGYEWVEMYVIMLPPNDFLVTN